MSDEALLGASNVKALEKALAAGANLEAKDDEGNTKLLLLCKSKSGAMSKTEAEMALLLITKGANATATNDDLEQPLHLAAASGNHDVIDALLKKGAKAGAVTKLNYTPLHFCVDTRSNDTWIWDTLLAAGCPIDHVNKWGDTAMYAASGSHNEKAVLYFLGKGASPTIKDSNGDTLRELAAKWGQPKVVKLLDAGGAKPTKEAPAKKAPAKKPPAKKR